MEQLTDPQFIEDFLKKESERLDIKLKFPELGSFALVTQKLKIKDKEFWDLFEDLIQYDIFRIDFLEIANCMEVFPFSCKVKSQFSPSSFHKRNSIKLLSDTHSESANNTLVSSTNNFYVNSDLLLLDKNFGHETSLNEYLLSEKGQKSRKAFKKLETYMITSVWETNMKHYHRIMVSLTQMLSVNKVAFKKIENHILNNLTMDYHPDLLLDIFVMGSFVKCFDKLTFQKLQHLIGNKSFDDSFMKGLTQEKNVKITSSYKLLQYLSAYKNLEDNFEQFEISPEIKTLMRNYIESGSLDWNINHFLPILRFFEKDYERNLKCFEIDQNEYTIIKQNLFDRIIYLLENQKQTISDLDNMLDLWKHIMIHYDEQDLNLFTNRFIIRLNQEKTLNQISNNTLFFQFLKNNNLYSEISPQIEADSNLQKNLHKSNKYLLS